MERESDRQTYQQLQIKLESARAKRAAAATMLQQIALNPTALSGDVAELYRQDFRQASEEQERLQSELNALLRSSDEVQALVQREAIALLRCLLREHEPRGAPTTSTDNSEAYALDLLAKLDSEEGER